MSLFICENCGCIENTALGFYWGREFANSGEIEMLMLNQACEWIRNEIGHYTDMIQGNK